jgi:integrase
MAKVNFYLKSGKLNKHGQKPIVMRITYDSQRTIIFVKEMIKERYWSKRNQRANKIPENEVGKNQKEQDFINDRIEAFESRALDLIKQATEKNIPLSDNYFKINFKNFDTSKTIKLTKKGFWELFNEFLEVSKTDKAKNTIKGYKTVLNFLKEFETNMNYHLDFNTIDLNFYDKLKNYAFSLRPDFNKKSDIVQDNYFSKVVNVLRTFWNWSYDRGHHNKQWNRKINFKEREKEVIFLTIDELMKLYRYEFKHDRHKKSRDLYCFGCFTGLRFSDIFQLEHDNIRNGSIILETEKTEDMTNIPLNQFALEILDKYKDSSPFKALPTISNQKLNIYIKECCEIAKINEPIQTIKHFGSKAERETKLKYELITTHTARKTFVTNSLVLGMNVKTIKDITGHKKDTTFNKYLKIAEDFKKVEMDNTWNKIK